MNTATIWTAITAATAISIAAIISAGPLAASTTPATTAAATPGATLSVQFTGIETPKGKIMMALFDSEAAFNGGRSVRAVMIAADSADATALVEKLPVGRYAIKSFHDIDGDGKMAKNLFGMPIEPYAFSNNAAGPASWADASFAVTAGANAHRIAIK